MAPGEMFGLTVPAHLIYISRLGSDSQIYHISFNLSLNSKHVSECILLIILAVDLVILVFYLGQVFATF